MCESPKLAQYDHYWLRPSHLLDYKYNCQAAIKTLSIESTIWASDFPHEWLEFENNT